MTLGLSAAEVEALRAAGRDPHAVRHQLRVLRSGPRPVCLERPCTVGDGIHTLDLPDLEAVWRSAAAAGRLAAFVPASGAASRMFAGLSRLLQEGPATLQAALAHPTRWVREQARVVEALPQLALWAELPEGVRGDHRALLSHLVAWSGGPKALVPFHLRDGASRTALSEQLEESASLVAAADGVSRVHLTVSPSWCESFQREVRRWPHHRVFLSVQDPATDTVCIDLDGFPVVGDGGLVFRPGGHGALLRNVEATGADVLLVKNIDNVRPLAARQAEVLPWRRRLVGALVSLQERVHAALRALDAGEDPDVRELLVALGLPEPADREALYAELHRPLRVCGMVRNEGEPGGGPFWRVGDPRPQIVEGAQIDHADPEQEAIHRRSTHFNPVELVLGLRDHRGEPYALDAYTDPGAVLVTRKQVAGRSAWVYEHPGLWNGAMARWNTVFYEVPLATFAPVKSVRDLLRPAHQG